MNKPCSSPTPRREFLKKTTGAAAAVSALAGIKIPAVHAAGSETLNVALIGCGGRGTGAAGNAMGQSGPPINIVAMADVFQHRLDNSFKTLSKQYEKQNKVTDETKFIGFDAYKKAIDCLKKDDVAILTTPLAFRAPMFKYAVEKGVNVFMEKPVTADGPKSRLILELNKQAKAKDMKVAVGLNSRHSRGMQQLKKRVQDGEIGEILFMRGYRMQPPVGSAFSEKYPGPDNNLPGKPNELLWQLSRFHSFIWASGGCFNDFFIHHLDHLCWMKDALPVKCQAVGGRHYRGNYIDQNFDAYACEYTFADGTKMLHEGRNMVGALPIYASYLHGTKGIAVCAKNGDCGQPSSIHKGQNPDRASMIWHAEENPTEKESHFNEWTDLVDAIRNNKPYNEVEYGISASVVGNMGRFAAHTAQEVTYDQMLNQEQEYAPNIENWTMDTPPPVKADADGKYPVPEPGIKKDREW